MNGILGTSQHKHSWSESLAAMADRRVITMLFLGFSAGVPILLVFSTLSVWLREAEVARATIGFFSWAALGYGFKFMWAPLIDRLPLPILTALMGQRRSWLLVSQFAVIAALALMASTDPLHNLGMMAGAAVLLGFSSATQDIVIDAYRIEAADKEYQGLMSASYIAGYRIGMLIAGAGALELAGILDVIEGYDYAAWRTTYLAMAGVMAIGVATTFVIGEPQRAGVTKGHFDTALDYIRFASLFVFSVIAFVAVFYLSSEMAAAAKAALNDSGMIKRLSALLVETLRLAIALGVAVVVGMGMIRSGLVPRAMAVDAYVAPFADFFMRFGRPALLILALIATYRIADVVMGVMANVFYVDLGFEKQEIGRISKGFGLIMTIVGGFLGGLLSVRFGVMRTLFVGGVLAAATNVLFAVLAGMGNVLWMLMAVIAADNLSAGIASAAFVAYLSSLTSRSFTATQYALFSSIMLLLPKLIAGYSGMMVESIGYATFFIATAVIGIVPLLLIIVVARHAPPGD
jgi:PAT family beta-lactamase induction signal transducer AmpG